MVWHLTTVQGSALSFVLPMLEKLYANQWGYEALLLQQHMTRHQATHSDAGSG
eukprot:CAMPEP_0175912162 /NCGR_PEP_ID=MMETSP0108-20121206/8578_1 /TAXON_ID=195067 ORGANISM="Goniomonas pacifica, Strain CCMP1869" /NCGR_SAMPLE_ID=MMETSP0108 /ASSEMBLY_ACC=CAM_ASM_000204 /LENGTH=52 /DNA_ID=CAMNT_0017234453 /DNA_START=417 /DNA_END=575 /DNA_ORIENTATION=-